MSISMFILGEGLAVPLSKLFVGYNPVILDMTIRDFRLYSFCFLIVGFNIFGSSFFTALNNGLVSAILSFLRLFLFQAITVLVMPLFMDLDGIWLSSTASEIMAIITTIIFIFALRKRYKY
jgi:Na+-driven multidrug efflux pump